ncbi:Protein STR-90 [Aphelenchoides avenae]|nr:Protein STR-90 [Aphelenchus avenae]
MDVPFWTDDQGRVPTFVAADVKDMRIVVLVSSCMVLSSIAYAVILTTNYMVMNKLRKESEHLSKATREVQSQLSRILLYQASLPVVFCVVPLALVFVFGAFSVKTCGYGLLLTILVSWIPVMNPLSTILFVRHYRAAIFRCNRCARRNLFSSQVSAISAGNRWKEATGFTRTGTAFTERSRVA